MKKRIQNKTLRRAIKCIKRLYYIPVQNEREQDYNQYIDSVLIALEEEFNIEIPN
ncbi:MAG: hypothetical protein AAF620_01290 [Bacteroidota bacterium]